MDDIDRHTAAHVPTNNGVKMHKKIAGLGCAVVLMITIVTVSGCGGNKATGASASVPFDRAFIDAMVPHHLSAIAMAKAARRAGLQRPVLKGIAANILVTQQAEIDEMKQWRKQWYGSADVDPKGAEGLGMSMDEMGMSHSAGDISNAEDVDAAFASMMIDHHEGAVAMAQLALTKATHPQIKQLAQQIIAAQQDEIRMMKPYAANDSMGNMHM